MSTSVQLENVTPSKNQDWKTPHELWRGKPFNLSWLQSFGCLSYVNLPKHKRDGKFGDTAVKGIFLGYTLGTHNYIVLKSDRQLVVSHNVQFNEDSFLGASFFDDNSSANFPMLDFLENKLESAPRSDSDSDVLAVDGTVPLDALQSLPANSLELDAVDSSPTTTDLAPLHPAKTGPGWDYVLTSDVAPKNIDSSINPNAILETTRRAHLARALLTIHVP